MNAERVLAIGRDAGCIALSLTGIAWQQYTGNVNALLLGAYMGLLGIPLSANVREIRQQARRGPGRGSTGTRVLQSPPSSPSSPSSSSSVLDPDEGGV